MFLFLAQLSASVVDAYTLGKEVQELRRFQHQNGGFFDGAREANAKDSCHALYVISTFGSFPYVDLQGVLRFAATLRNRDGGAGMSPGQKSSIEATWYYYKIQTTLTQGDVDVPSIVEFLKSNYHKDSGLFRDTADADPSVEATYYAYQLLTKFETDLSWLQTFNTRNYIQDHSSDDRFKFEGVDETDAQIYGAVIAKCISVSGQSFRLSTYASKRIEEGIKAGNITVEEIGKLAEGLEASEGGDNLPAETNNYIKLSDSLTDLYYSTVILSKSKDINKFFDVMVYGVTPDNQQINIEKDGVTIQQIIRPVLQIVSLQRFVNPLFGANISMTVADEQVISEMVQFNQQTASFPCQRLTQITRLGQLTIDVDIYLSSRNAAPIQIQKNIVSHISLPLDITCDATINGDDSIQQGGEVVLGTQFKSVVHARIESGIELEENTAVTFSVQDAAGVQLYYENADFKNDYTFQYTLDAKYPIPNGLIKVAVEVGDRQNGIHTRQEFRYQYRNTLAVVDAEIEGTPKLGELLKVKMHPGILQDGELVNFVNQEQFDCSNLHDASTEAYFPPSVIEAHKYTMLLKCGGALIKAIEGEVKAGDNEKVEVNFETSVEENIDSASGFNIEFEFVSEEGVPTPLHMANELPVKLDAEIVVDSLDGLKGGKIAYGDSLKVDVVVKEQKSSKILFPGRAYPVLLIKKGDQIISERSGKADEESGKVSIELPIDASIPTGNLVAEICIKKGHEYLPVPFNGKEVSTKYSVDGNLVFNAEITNTPDAILVDYTSTFQDKAIYGGYFQGRIYRPDGQLVAELPVASMMSANRLSIPTAHLSGEYTVELVRYGDNQALLQTKVTVQNKLLHWITSLPFELIVLLLSFAIFAWAIKIRKTFRVVPLK